MRTIAVASIAPDQWRDYRDIRLAALADAPHAFGSTLRREKDFTEAEWRTRLERGRCVLGCVDGTAVATAAAIPSPDHPGDTELVGVWVHPAARGIGVAAAVVRAALDPLATRVHVWIAEDNPSAERLYTRLGFRHTGMRKPLPSDADRDEFAMVLEPE